MAFWNRQDTLGAAVEDWQRRGLVSAELGATLRDDIDASRTTRSFNAIAVVLGVVCLAFGAVTFVAANWDEMSRLARVILLFASLWASWGMAIFFQQRQQGWLAQCFVLLACALFGATIMLLGQIYHLQGDARDAVWLWAVGAFVGALLTRSIPALCLTIALFSLWGIWDLWDHLGDGHELAFSYLVYSVFCGVAALWMRSRTAGHLVLFGIVVWVISYAVINLGNNFSTAMPLVGCLSLFLVVQALMLTSDGAGQRKFERPALIYCFAEILCLTIVWYFAKDDSGELFQKVASNGYWPGIVALACNAGLAAWAITQKNDNRYDLLVSALFTALVLLLMVLAGRIPFVHEGVLLALTIWMVRMGWRINYGPLARLGYAAFSGVMLLIYWSTVGSIVGTSTFYLGAGILILFGVFAARWLTANKEGAV